MSKPVKGLMFRLAQPKTKRTVATKALTKKIYCVCVMSEDGEFKANLRIVSNKLKITNLCVPFTLASYSCKGKERVFSKKLDERGKRICYIRTPDQAKVAPSKSLLYTPFCEDWVYSGKLVQIKGQRYFDIAEAIWHKDFCQEDLDIQEKDIKL